MKCPARVIALMAAAALLAATTALPAYANAPAPRVTIAFEFIDENGQPVTPAGLQLARYSSYDEKLIVHHHYGTCDLPGCLELIEDSARNIIYDFTCHQNHCFSNLETFVVGEEQHMVLVPESATPLDKALIGTFPGRSVSTGQVAGWRVVVTPDGLVISEDQEAAAGAPVYHQSYSFCASPASPAMAGFAITQTAELLVAFLLLLLLGIPLRLFGGILTAVALINFATFPVVWLTFPALGPAPTTQAQAVAVLTLLAALLYMGLLVRLRPAFDPARRSALIGGLAVALPMVTVLIFGAATAASAAINTAGIASAAAAGAGLPYHVTMPASEVFAYSAEALLVFLLCRPALAARQALMLSVLANSASLALGLFLL